MRRWPPSSRSTKISGSEDPPRHQRVLRHRQGARRDDRVHAKGKDAGRLHCHAGRGAGGVSTRIETRREPGEPSALHCAAAGASAPRHLDHCRSVQPHLGGPSAYGQADPEQSWSGPRSWHHRTTSPTRTMRTAGSPSHCGAAHAAKPHLVLPSTVDAVAPITAVAMASCPESPRGSVATRRRRWAW